MFAEVFKFELKYRSVRPATYIYFALIFALSLAFMSTEDIISLGGGMGQVKKNANAVVAQVECLFTLLFFMVASAVMGVAVLRDFEHKTESIMFTTPLNKTAYLMGRFLGSFVVLLFIFSGLPLGLMLGELMPWIDADKYLPFSFARYWQPFLTLVVPNLFFSGVLFFVSGALSRKMIVVYTQGIILIVIYLMLGSMMGDLDNKEIAAVLDPFATRTVGYITDYWSISQQNNDLVPFEGALLYNRLFVLALGALVLGLCLYVFKFQVILNPLIRPKKQKEVVSNPSLAASISIPKVHQILNLSTYIKQITTLTNFYFRTTLKEIPFIAIVICGLILLISNSQYINMMYGIQTYPTTYSMLEVIQGFNLFLLIIMVFYSGEMIWRERQVNINLIYDAFPMPDFVSLVSKFLAMALIYCAVFLLLIVTGVLIQTFQGYYKYELGIYFTSLYTSSLLGLLLYTLLAFFIQVMVNDKFVGYAVIVVFFIANLVLSQLGLEHQMFSFGSASMGTYSDMNSYGHFPISFSWYSLYWSALSVVLFGVAVLLSVRGSESLLKTRLKIGKVRMGKGLIALLILSFCTFGFTGCFIYYNTNMLNSYSNSDDLEKLRVDYEKTLKKYENIPQPRIVETKLKVDIFPEERDFIADGFYILKNKSNTTISDIHISYPSSAEFVVQNLSFEGGSKLKQEFKDFRYYIHTLNKPLAPNDSVKMSFKIHYKTEGFKEGGNSSEVVYNGTFFNNTNFPTLGYEEAGELSDEDKRKEYGLKPKERAKPRTDPHGLDQCLFGDDADRIRFEITLSTSKDQIAIAPGYLKKQWVEKDRNHYLYSMEDAPMVNFYNIVSAKYEVMRQDYKGVKLEIYYHKGHEYNLERMMTAMKKSLDYYNKAYSPYQYRQIRILEFPRYSSFAQSFANTIPYSEGIGFIMNIKEEDNDMVTFVTAHEIAHQWWGHQVTEAAVIGSSMLSESMSEYSALMVMKQMYPEEQMQKFLKYELDRYLLGRASEKIKEQPLFNVESQQYIHYNKGSLVFYALQDYIGEDSINMAFSRYVKDWKYRGNPYPTSVDMLKYIKDVTPDSLQYLVTDMFERIVLYENKAEKASFIQEGNRYKVTIEAKVEKFEADSLGVEQKRPLADWIDVAVMTKIEGKDKIVYRKKHKFTKEKEVLVFCVDKKPSKAGLDPINMLIDKHPEDNMTRVIEEKAK
ncbi:MAG: aminopeptidase [Cytophagales bacterium]|nr:MAG: aminopeptidase [Cytophagales bacterium]TAF60047.1 MAG: aminopeptidase [Cytophagales bacterium]